MHHTLWRHAVKQKRWTRIEGKNGVTTRRRTKDRLKNSGTRTRQSRIACMSWWTICNGLRQCGEHSIWSCGLSWHSKQHPTDACNESHACRIHMTGIENHVFEIAGWISGQCFERGFCSLLLKHVVIWPPLHLLPVTHSCVSAIGQQAQNHFFVAASLS